MVQAKKTAAYRVIAGPGGKRVFRFYCDISGDLSCVTKSIRADTEDEALEIAWALSDHPPKAGGRCEPRQAQAVHTKPAIKSVSVTFIRHIML